MIHFFKPHPWHSLKNGYQMKDIIFPLIPHESVWIYWLGHHEPAKLSTFPHPIMLKNEEKVLAHFFQNAVIQLQIKIFPCNQLKMATNFLNFPREKLDSTYQEISTISKRSWSRVIKLSLLKHFNVQKNTRA